MIEVRKKPPKVITVSTLRFLLVCSFLGQVILFLFAPEEVNKAFVVLNLVSALISTIIFFLFSMVIQKGFQLLSISTLFILSFSIVHFQIPFFFTLDIAASTSFLEYFLWGNLDVICRSVSISTLGLIAFFVGYSMFAAKKRKFAAAYPSFYWLQRKSNANFLVWGAVISYIVFFLSSGSYRYGAYYAGDASPVAQYFFTIFDTFLSAAIVWRIYCFVMLDEPNTKLGRYLSFFGPTLLGLLTWHLAFSVFVGDRGPVIYYLILSSSIYFVRCTRFGLLHLALIMLISVPALNIMGASRSRSLDVGYSDRISQGVSGSNERFNKYFSGGSIFLSGTIELALSVRTLNHAILNVPSTLSHTYGTFQIQQILAVFPGVVGNYLKIVHGGDKKMDGSANFVSFLIQGEHIEYGDGTTPSADLYLDFGVLGVVLGFYCFGVFSYRADLCILKGTPSSLFLWVSAMLFLAGGIYLARGTFLFYFQKVVFVYFSIVLSNSLNSLARGRGIAR